MARESLEEGIIRLRGAIWIALVVAVTGQYLEWGGGTGWSIVMWVCLGTLLILALRKPGWRR